MCGIVAGFNKADDINEEVLLQFEDQSSRGTNGFGSIFIDKDGKFTISRSTGQIKAIIDAYRTPAKTMIFHHRMPSSSKNKISQTHPIKISSGDLKHDYYFVHNGVIRNDTERKKYHNDELGYVYSTDVEVPGWNGKVESMFNDSEVLGYDIARFIEGQTKEIKTAGSAAFIMTQVNKKTQKVKKVFYGRNDSNPLKLAKNRNYIFLSSEGKGETVKEDMLYSFKLDDYKIQKKKMAIPTTFASAVTKEEETKSDTAPKHIGYNTDDDDDGGIDAFGSFARARSLHNNGSYASEDWMTYEEETVLDEYLDAAQAEIDAARDTIKECVHGEELYLLDTEDIIKNIAINLSQGVDYARRLKTSEYVQAFKDEESVDDDPSIDEMEEDKVLDLTKTKAN